MKRSLLTRRIGLAVGSGFLLVLVWPTLPVLASAIRPLPTIAQPARQVPSPTPDPEQQLQIMQLEQETSWQGQLRGYLPAGSALVALSAIFWSAVIYFRDQRKDRELRIEQTITENLGQIIGYSKGETTVSAQAVGALDNLNALASKLGDKEALTQRVTNVIVVAVMEDIDFANVRQVRFDGLCLDNWPPYSRYIESHPAQNQYLIYRYLSALYELHDRQREYMDNVVYDDTVRKFVHPEEIVMKPEDDYRLFQRLIQGVQQHWPMVDDPTQRTDLIDTFVEATGSRNLAEQLFGRA